MAPATPQPTTDHRQGNPNPNLNPHTIDPNNPNNMNSDEILSGSKFLHRMEVLKRRHKRTKQLERIYRDYYWSLMEEVKMKHREYCWKYGTSPFEQDTNGGDNNIISCGIDGCESKPMALTKFCHTHILSDSNQKLYKACNYPIKSSPKGPIRCGAKPILSSTIPSYCSGHLQKAEKHLTQALKKAGLNVSNTSKLAPKFHVIVAEYVSQIQKRRRAAQKAALANPEVEEENSS